MKLNLIEVKPGRSYVAECDSLVIRVEDRPWEVGAWGDPADPYTVLDTRRIDGWIFTAERYGETLTEDDEIHFHDTIEQGHRGGREVVHQRGDGARARRVPEAGAHGMRSRHWLVYAERPGFRRQVYRVRKGPMHHLRAPRWTRGTWRLKFRPLDGSPAYWRDGPAYMPFRPARLRGPRWNLGWALISTRLGRNSVAKMRRLRDGTFPTSSAIALEVLDRCVAFHELSAHEQVAAIRDVVRHYGRGRATPPPRVALP